MRLKTLVPFLLLAAWSGGASAMPVAAFLAKANALQKKGPMALFSGDLKLLMNQIKRDAAELRAENKAAEAAGRRKAYCTPDAGVKLTNRDVMDAMNAIPAAQRSALHTKDAMRAYLARRYPCRG